MPVRVIFALDRVSFHFLLSSFAAGQACRSHVRSSIAEPALVLIYLHSETPPHFPSLIFITWLTFNRLASQATAKEEEILQSTLIIGHKRYCNGWIMFYIFHIGDKER